MAEPRGEGAELRSDGHVAVRGKEGVLISAEAAARADGSQMARAGLIGLAELMQSVADELAKLAEQQAGDEKSSSPLAELVGKLKSWEGGSNTAPEATPGAPIVAMSAPGGIVVGSQEHVGIGSERKVDIVSGANTEIVAGNNFFVRAVRGVSAFAHSIGIKLVAGGGNVTVEAQQGTVEVKSYGRISLISSEAIHIEAPSIRIVSEGAQTEWAGSKITQQSAGEHMVRAASVLYAGPGDGSPAAPGFAAGKMQSDERLVLRHLQTREPIPSQRYIAHLENGKTIRGVSDEQGRTALVQSDMLGPVRFELLP